jgi:transposase
VEDGSLQLSLFDERDLVEVRHPDYPGERLMACKNPLLLDRRRRKRQELLDATEKGLEKIKAATDRQRRPLRGKEKIVARATKVLDRYKVGKHFVVAYREDGLSFRRNEEKIQAEAMLDGIYVVRTSVPAETMGAEETVGAYKGLSVVERAFRSMKTVDLKVRPIYHHLEDRVRAHVFLCMLAYYVEWHMRQALAPVLFDDDNPKGAQTLRTSIVAPAKRSVNAQRKAATKRTDSDAPVHSFRTLLGDLATIAKHRIRPRTKGVPSFDKITLPTPVQKEILGLLGIRLKPVRSQ